MTNGSPLVSVIMPVWNPRRDWFLAAVASVLAQTACRFELIVVDDGCDAPVSDLIPEIADERMRVIRIPHGGQAAACNAGIADAQGEWIRFVDADDVLPAGSMSHLMSMMDGDRVIAYGATLNCDAALDPRSLLATTLQGDVVVDCLVGRFDVRHPALLFPRKTIELSGPWEPLGVSSDWDFVLRALEHSPVRGDRTVVLHYRRHAGSMTGAASLAAGEESWRRILVSYFDRHADQRGTSFERVAWATFHARNARRYARAGLPREAFSRVARSAWRDLATGARAFAGCGMQAVRASK